MASPRTPASGPNPMDFYRSLLSFAKRGLMTVDQVQAVWDAYSQVLPSGAPHLAEVTSVWAMSLEAIRTGRLSWQEALGQWATFLRTGLVTTLGSSLVGPDAAALVRPTRTADPVFGTATGASGFGPGPGPGGGPPGGTPIEAINGGGVAYQSNFQVAPPCYCCLVRKSLVVDVPGHKPAYWNRQFRKWSHDLSITLSVEWVNALAHSPCVLEWWEWGRGQTATAGYAGKDKWVDLYKLASFNKIRGDIVGLPTEQPRQFEQWRKDMEDPDCPKAEETYVFKDRPSVSQPPGDDLVVRNFLIRFRCSGTCEELRPADCQPPVEVKLQQRIQFDNGRQIEPKSYLAKLEDAPIGAFVDHTGRRLEEQNPTNFDPVKFYKDNDPDGIGVKEAIREWEKKQSH